MILKTIREDMKLTPAAFARLVGVSRSRLHDWENGRRLLTLENAALIERTINRTGIVDAVVRERTAA